MHVAVPAAAAASSSSSGFSTTDASVVSTSAAIEAAFCSADRVTLAGIDDPGLHHVDPLAGGGVEAVPGVALAAELLRR